MMTWTEFERAQPALAKAGRDQLYGFGIGLAFLGTVRAVRAALRDMSSTAAG